MTYESHTYETIFGKKLDGEGNEIRIPTGSDIILKDINIENWVIDGKRSRICRCRILRRAEDYQMSLILLKERFKIAYEENLKFSDKGIIKGAHIYCECETFKPRGKKRGKHYQKGQFRGNFAWAFVPKDWKSTPFYTMRERVMHKKID